MTSVEIQLPVEGLYLSQTNVMVWAEDPAILNRDILLLDPEHACYLLDVLGSKRKLVLSRLAIPTLVTLIESVMKRSWPLSAEIVRDLDTTALLLLKRSSVTKGKCMPCLSICPSRSMRCREAENASRQTTCQRSWDRYAGVLPRLLSARRTDFAVDHRGCRLSLWEGPAASSADELQRPC